MGYKYPIPLLYAALFSFCVIVMAIPRSRVRNTTAAAVLVGFFALLTPQESQPPSKDFQPDYALVIVFPVYALTLAVRAFIRDGQKECWRLSEGPEAFGKMTFAQRLKWSAALLASARGNGWNWQISQIPKPLPRGYNRWAFAREQLLRAVPLGIIVAAVVRFQRQTPQALSPIPVPPSAETPIREFVLVGAQLIHLWATMDLTYIAASILSVCVIPIYEPADWAPLFGRFRDGYTLRNFWGRVWHQNLRVMWLSISRWITWDLCGFQKGSFASSVLQLYISFGLTAFYHWYGSFLLAGHSRYEWTAFLSLATAILVEDRVIKWAKDIGIKDAWYWRTLGYLWVTGTIYGSMRLYMGEAIAQGAWLP